MASSESTGNEYSMKHTKEQTEEETEDKVNVYLVYPSENLVSSSPPCLKLVTFLRMAKIPHNSIYGWRPSTKGKMPWIEYKEKAVADSNFSVQYLNEQFGVDIDEHLTAEQKAVATAFLVMLEENTYWTLVHHFWLTPHSIRLRDRLFKDYYTPMKHVLFKLTQRTIRGYLHAHGIGRHTEQELYGIAERDLKAVSAYLDEKKFLFGDKPCLADASLFGLVAAFIWEIPESPQGVLIRKQLTNLVAHAEFIRETYFPDWDNLLLKPQESQ